MLQKLRNARKRLAGFFDWMAIYPLVFTPRGREQIVRYLFSMARQHPEMAEEFRRLADRVKAEEELAASMRRSGAAEAAKAQREDAAERQFEAGVSGKRPARAAFRPDDLSDD